MIFVWRTSAEDFSCRSGLRYRFLFITCRILGIFSFAVSEVSRFGVHQGSGAGSVKTDQNDGFFVWSVTMQVDE